MTPTTHARHARSRHVAPRRATAGARVLAIALAAFAFLLSTPRAQAQMASLPVAIITSVNLTGADVQTISEFVGARVAELNSDDPADNVRAANALNEPLSRALPDGQTRSFAFRRAYEQALAPHLDKMLVSPERGRVFVAMRLSGNLATDNATQRLIGMIGPEHDAPTRLFASSQFRSTFEIVANAGQAPPVTDTRMLEAIDAIRESAGSEPNALVLDAHARALVEAGQITAGGLDGVGPAAYEALARIIQWRAQTVALSPESLEELTPIVRALEALQTAMITQSYPYSEAMLVQSTGLAADVMAYLIARQKAEQPPLTEPRVNALVGSRDALDVVMMSYAENILVFAREQMARLNNDPPPSPDPNSYSEMLKSVLETEVDRDRRRLLTDLQREFVNTVVTELTQPPYGFVDDRFVARLED